MKTLNWTKVPDTLVCGGKSIWSDVTKEAQQEDVENKLNFKQVEELFCQKVAPAKQEKATTDKKKREPALVILGQTLDVISNTNTLPRFFFNISVITPGRQEKPQCLHFPQTI